MVDIQRARADASGGLDCDCFKKAMVSPERGAHLFGRYGETKKPPAKVSRPRRGRRDILISSFAWERPPLDVECVARWASRGLIMQEACRSGRSRKSQALQG
jgi:hypothetical protein